MAETPVNILWKGRFSLESVVFSVIPSAFKLPPDIDLSEEQIWSYLTYVDPHCYNGTVFLYHHHD